MAHVQDEEMHSGEPQPDTTGGRPRKMTFKEKVLEKATTEKKEAQNLVYFGVMRFEKMNGNRLFLSFEIDETMYQQICHFSLYCCLPRLGRLYYSNSIPDSDIYYSLFEKKICQPWKGCLVLKLGTLGTLPCVR